LDEVFVSLAAVLKRLRILTGCGISDGGIVVTLMASKASQDQSETIVVPAEHMPKACAALETWAAVAKLKAGEPVFRAVDQWQIISAGRLTDRSVRMVGARIRDRDWVKAAYAQGVPMGGDLTPMPASGKTLSFAVWAVKDPTSGNLDRIQIIKGWTKSGQSFEKVFDVAWAGDREPNKSTGVVAPIGSTVDFEKAMYTNSIGAVELKSVWTDPEFDATVPAFYYARVLEIPTPRWTTFQAAQLGISPPDVVPAAIQERAWSSPI
jgi:hypothetical protein